MTRVPLPVLKDQLAAAATAIVAQLVPDAKRFQAGWMASPPGETQQTPSFQIYGDGSFFDHKTKEGGSALDLVMRALRTDLPGACRWAEDFLGLKQFDPAKIRRLQSDADARRVAWEKKQAEEKQKKRERARSLWFSAAPIASGDLAHAYLAGRGIALEDVRHLNRTDGKLSGEMEHWQSATYEQRNGIRQKVAHGLRAQAMIWPVRMAAGGVTGIHCTFLRWVENDGEQRAQKLGTGCDKLMLGDVRGGVVTLAHGPDDIPPQAFDGASHMRHPVIVCEGIETGLSLALAIPEARVWAALSLGNIAQVPVQHPCAGEFIIALENDIKPDAVQQRDKVLDALERALGKPVRTMTPPRGSDFNDTLTE